MDIDEQGPAWVRLTVLLGVPAVIAMFLVYSMVGSVTAKLISIEMKLDYHETQRLRDMSSMNAFLYAICLNGAQTEVERARCAVALDTQFGFHK